MKVRELIEDVSPPPTSNHRWINVHRNHDVEEIVAMFLHVLTHDVKNQVIKREFLWSSETFMTFQHSLVGSVTPT